MHETWSWHAYRFALGFLRKIRCDKCSGTTLRVHLRRPLVFFVVLTCWEICFSLRRYPTFFFLFWIIIPAILPATMLGHYSMSASLMPSKFFSSLFRSIGSQLPIGRHSTSLRSAKLRTGWLLSRFVLFFFGPTCVLFDLSIALRPRHELSKVAAPTPRSGDCETWVPLGPHRPGSQPSPTSGSGLPEDPSTCQWAQPT
jgi:hypothetical protein